MKLTRPSFFDEFECIADKCNYNCCHTWCITLDDKTVEKYKTFEGSFGDKIRSFMKLSDSGKYVIKFDENGKCPMLTENGLCEIVLKKGPEYISEVCKVFPKMFTMYTGIAEIALSNACPAVVEFMYREKKLSFETYEIDDVLNYDFDDEMGGNTAFCREIRQNIINLLQLEEFPLWGKEYIVSKSLKKIEELYKKNDFEAIRFEMKIYGNSDYLKKYIESLENLEPNYELKISFLQNLYAITGGIKENVLMKYYNKIISGADNLTIEEIIDIYKRFDGEVLKDIEYVFENCLVNDLFYKFLIRTEKTKGLNIYERCMSIFMIQELIKFVMCMYWYANDKSINKSEQIGIISILSRKLLHNDKEVLRFCRYCEEKGFFSTAYLFIILR